MVRSRAPLLRTLPIRRGRRAHHQVEPNGLGSTGQILPFVVALAGFISVTFQLLLKTAVGVVTEPEAVELDSMSLPF